MRKCLPAVIVVVLLVVAGAGLYATLAGGWSEWTGQRTQPVNQAVVVLGGLGALGAVTAAFVWVDRINDSLG